MVQPKSIKYRHIIIVSMIIELKYINQLPKYPPPQKKKIAFTFKLLHISRQTIRPYMYKCVTPHVNVRTSFKSVNKSFIIQRWSSDKHNNTVPCYYYYLYVWKWPSECGRWIKLQQNTRIIVLLSMLDNNEVFGRQLVIIMKEKMETLPENKINNQYNMIKLNRTHNTVMVHTVFIKLSLLRAKRGISLSSLIKSYSFIYIL